MGNMYISIPRDFATSPAGRTPKDGPFNGQRFRTEFLIPALEEALKENADVVVDFDDADSYSSSFLEEAFGGLVRLKRFAPSDIKQHLILRSNDPVYFVYKEDAKNYINDELAKVR